MESRGTRLKKLRRDFNLSLCDLSKYLEISCEDVKNLENDSGKLNLTILIKLSICIVVLKDIYYAYLMIMNQSNMLLEAMIIQLMI